MPITLFYHFVITSADATSGDLGEVGENERFYHITEASPQHWAVAAHGQPVAIDRAQQAQLAQLLAALSPFPDPTIEPLLSGNDGIWQTVIIQRGDQQLSYRWWERPPSEWDTLAALTQLVQQLADAPRRQQAERQRQLMRRFFTCLAARDLAGMQALYHSDIRYSSPLFELRGAQVGALWRMCWSYLPDMRVDCSDTDIRGGSVYWRASYTYPPTGRYVEQHLTADLTIVHSTIIQHRDRFNVHEWAHDAYGIVGRMLGGSRVFEHWLAARARARVAPFLPE